MSFGKALVAAALLLSAVPAEAQRTTTGTVAGRVVDANGGVLPGVTVTVKSPEALGAFSAVTDAQGVFRVTNLPPATYDIRVELSGFQSVVRREAVRLGAVTQVDVSMAVGSISETVTVQGVSPLVDAERAGLSVNVNNLALTSVPITTTRRFQDVWQMVPGVYINPVTQEPGNLGSERRTSIDGMDVTDPYGGDINTVNLNYEAIQDVEVKALGAEASDGASMVGQFMNVVTKSGGNELHGSGAYFVIPQRFNDSNVSGVAPNQRKEIQPDMTLGGPILRDRIWFFGSLRRVQADQTFNNAPVPRETRGNLYFVKFTTQFSGNHRLSATVQYDRTRQKNAVIRGAENPGQRGVSNTSAGLSGATMSQTAPSAFGTLVRGGPMIGTNYNWVMSNTRIFQFVTSWMISKPSNGEPNEGTMFGATKVIQTNAANNILGSLTTIAQEGNFGAIDKADRSMLYLAPSMTMFVNRMGSHEFRGGADLYPFIRNVTSSVTQPVEYYFRPPGTTGSADVLFERRTLRNFAGNGATVANEAYERHYAGYFQDRWKLKNISIKAGVRVETNSIFTTDRAKVLASKLPANFPTNTDDREFHQVVGMPNVGMSWEAGKYGVFRATANRSYEWLDLGGGDGTSHAPYVLTTDIIRANPRGGALNETLPGQFALGVAYGDEKDGSIRNGRTYNNEFSAGWEHALPGTSSFGTTFVWRRFWDYQSGDDKNVIRNPATGQFLGRLFPDFDTVRNTYNPNYTWQENRSIQFLYTKNFAGNWGINSSYWYNIQYRHRTRWNPTSDTLQFLGFSPQDDETAWSGNVPHQNARLSTFARLPLDTMFSVFYTYTQGRRFDITTGDFPLNATAPRVVLSNGRSVADPFFNPTYPRARRRDADMLQTDSAHLVNLRLQKTINLGQNRRIDLSGDIFNLFNTGSAFGFVSVDDRSATFGQKSAFVQPRVGQLGVRIVF